MPKNYKFYKNPDIDFENLEYWNKFTSRFGSFEESPLKLEEIPEFNGKLEDNICAHTSFKEYIYDTFSIDICSNGNCKIIREKEKEF